MRLFEMHTMFVKTTRVSEETFLFFVDKMQV